MAYPQVQARVAPCAMRCSRPRTRQGSSQKSHVKPEGGHLLPAKSMVSAVLVQLFSLAVAGQLHAAESGLPEALTVTSSGYVPSPYEPSWEVWAGAAFGAFPFIIASYEFGKRVLIQRRCEKCRGKGLIQNSRGRYVKCQQCGGMLPWLGWKMFFFSTARPGNGGPLLQPRGQTSIFYKVPPPLPTATAEVPDGAGPAEGPAGFRKPAAEQQAGSGQPAAEQSAGASVKEAAK